MDQVYLALIAAFTPLISALAAYIAVKTRQNQKKLDEVHRIVKQE